MIKRLWAFLKGLFVKPDPFTEEEKAAVKKLKAERDAFIAEKIRKKRLTPAEQRYEWLCSTGYTPYVHLGTDPKPDPKLSAYRVCLNVAKNKGSAMRKAGKKIIRISARKNKWGLDMAAYT